jgi:hypothetical protein
MKGAKGNCQIGTVIKTKFDTEKNCIARMQDLKDIGVLMPDQIHYLCKSCGMWHIGTIEQSK